MRRVASAEVAGATSGAGAVDEATWGVTVSKLATLPKQRAMAATVVAVTRRKETLFFMRGGWLFVFVGVR
jgi:hypothetical protein